MLLPRLHRTRHDLRRRKRHPGRRVGLRPALVRLEDPPDGRQEFELLCDECLAIAKDRSSAFILEKQMCARARRRSAWRTGIRWGRPGKRIDFGGAHGAQGELATPLRWVVVMKHAPLNDLVREGLRTRYPRLMPTPWALQAGVAPLGHPRYDSGIAQGQGSPGKSLLGLPDAKFFEKTGETGG
jgi:hypothetical protein